MSSYLFKLDDLFENGEVLNKNKNLKNKFGQKIKLIFLNGLGFE